jgi:hypothetical protein
MTGWVRKQMVMYERNGRSSGIRRSLAGAGVGAVGAISLDFPVSAQRAATPPLIREIRRQLKQALGKMRNGQSGGARQLATTLRIYASTVNDDQLRGALCDRRKNSASTRRRCRRIQSIASVERLP